MINNVKRFLEKTVEVLLSIGFGIPALWVICNCFKVEHSVKEFWTVLTVCGICLIATLLVKVIITLLDGISYRHSMAIRITDQKTALCVQDVESRIAVNRLEMNIDF